MARRRNVPSSIDRLPVEIQDAIAELRRNGQTVDKILAHILQMGAEVSRSALGRHVKSLAEIGEDMRRAETMAKFVVDRFGEESDDRVARANMRILQAGILELLTERPTDDDGQVIQMTVGEAKELSLAMQRLVSATAQDAERQLRMRKEFAQVAAAEAERVMKSKGVSAETLAELRQAVLGAAG